MKLLLVFGMLAILFVSHLVAQANPVPFVSQPLMPASIAPGSGPLALTVNGASFVPGAVVTWNGAPQPTTYVSSTRLTANIAASLLVNAATITVAVFNPTPGGGNSNQVFLSITSSRSSVTVTTSSVSTGVGPFPIAVGDFNRDGNLDVAVANQTDFTVSVLLGKGDGTFFPRVDYSLGPKPTTQAHLGLIVSDFNQDNIPDLAIAGGPNVTVFLGKGDGTFGPASHFSTLNGPESLVAGDFNRDGHVDIAVGTSTINGVDTLLLGNGDGTFRRGTNFLGGKNAVAVTTGAFTISGFLDLATLGNALHENAVYFLPGKGDGTFGTLSKDPTGSLPKSIQAADLNGDDRLDLIVTDNGADSVSVLLGNGDGTFLSHVEYPAGTKPIGLALADVNGDGMLDLVVTCVGTNQMAILLGNGNGTFQTPAFYKTGKSPRAVAVGDFNNDGKLDFVVANWGSNTLTVLIQN
jgi:FG-GAP-like repeat